MQEHWSFTAVAYLKYCNDALFAHLAEACVDLS